MHGTNVGKVNHRSPSVMFLLGKYLGGYYCKAEDFFVIQLSSVIVEVKGGENFYYYNRSYTVSKLR